MKTYVKTIEAEQFNGDIESLKEFIGTENELIESEGRLTLVTKIDSWNVVPTDFVTKGYYGLLVFKQDRFLKEFKEVNTKSVTEPVLNSKPLLDSKPVPKKEVKAEK